ncbi:helicase-exonuclease AddAB subunit AddA [Clostridium celatum]|uniref:ATP-dependent helicase/nuclease subunit A n=1 Tax=Clostridium celatum DSM 1785 TaxID=545697 RepID=L1QIX4_9CLOT|nr:helicase-exonuclease AddAB subunit AddA [Clostridium celatum]EKY27969.1 ATP-dependent nuclease subunit A [Clostridium celatum DSM 1785]MDU2265100.1 helicase-exonuclease AddAB subunit AddA [Clostridium celatum]MDU6294592.1 helicase-exonuclease AddAB subunit AddA [Clostridium celatum]MDY3361041.1 helicase-exonuclease AddAB subunit AddA [Clostridium celatum]
MGETKWTNEQAQAIKTRNCNLLVAAAAGSGKTAVLVERIIKIITNEENPVDIDKLLVVTFTSAAAAEMRERIAAAISKELEKSPNSKNLQRQLTLLSRANITTMHSFCLEVIKNYFYTIDLDPSFRIGDETEATLMKNEIIEELFDEYYEEENEDFKDLLEAYSGSKDDEKLKEMILSLHRFSMSGPWPEKWLIEKAEAFNINTLEELDKTEWVKVLKDSLRVEIRGFLNMYKKALEIIEYTDGLSPYLEAFNSDYGYLYNAYESLNEDLTSVYNALNAITFITLKRLKKSEVLDENAQETVKAIREGVKKKVKSLIESSFEFTPGEALDGIKEVYPFMKTLANITVEFAKRFDEKKREKNILDFNDLEHLCLKILIDRDEENNIIPSNVAEHFRNYFDEVLVDEYQDSNDVQETIINLVSRRLGDNPNVFMVGDMKQSIYRFRQAKPKLFKDKYDSYSEEDESKDRKILLYKNFRSRQEVIDGANYIFKMVMSEVVGELEYTDKEALNLGASFEIPKDEKQVVGGEIELHIIDKSGLVKEENNDFNEDDSEQAKEDEEDIDGITLEAKVVAKRIKELFEERDGKKFQVFDKDTKEYRDVKFKDIVILLRATKNWAEIFLDELGSEGIPVYADTGSGYFESIEIRTIMSLLKVIDNPLQDVPMIATLRSPIVGFSAEELSDLRLLNKDLYFYEVIKCVYDNEFEVSDELRFKCVNFIDNLSKWRDRAIYTPIDEFIWYLYMDTGFYGYVGAMPNGKLRQANLKILFQRAKQYESTSFKGLFNFINFINKLRKSSGDMGSAKVLGENEDVVRIMSIHKSKGLEFPIVFTSGTGKQFNLMDLTNSILYHEELGFGPNYVNLETRNSYSTLPKEAIKKKIRLETLSEEMRILYVAFTRAKEKLIITGASSNLEKDIKKWVSAASLDENIVLPSEVLKGKSYLDWIAMAMCKHRDGEKLREIVDNYQGTNKDELSTWGIKFWTKDLLTVDKILEAVDKNEEEDLFKNSKDIVVGKEIKRRLDYKYKFIEGAMLPSNISVSDLKKKDFTYGDDIPGIVEVFKEKEIIKPRFLKEEKGLSAAERGTIMHYVMQRINYDRVNSINEIKNQIEEMVLDNSLTEKEANSIWHKQILNFFRSDLGKRLLKAYKEGRMVSRELPFFTELSSTEYDKSLDEKIYKNEKIRLQGIIDCFFEEEDGIVLLDYKTDYVEEGQEEKIIERYKSQLKYYKDALEKITGKVVKETYLYLFKLDKEVSI